MKIFITGIAGFVGQNLFAALRDEGYDVFGCDIEDKPHIGFPYIRGDCRNLNRMNKWLEGMDVVIHCAAHAHEGLSVFSPLAITDSIYRASVSTFSAAISQGVKRIVFCSSMSRYGSIKAPFHECDDPRPVDPYGIAKLASERTLECLAKLHDIEYVIAVPHNIYGPFQTYNDPYRNVIAIWMNRIMQGKAPIVYGNGLQRRCFSYIDDVIPCFIKMATADDDDMLGRVINIGPDHGEVCINEALAYVRNAMFNEGLNVPPTIHMPARPAEVHHANCHGELSRAILGYKPQVELEKGIAKMAAWIIRQGPKPFIYDKQIEILRDYAPRTWTHEEM